MQVLAARVVLTTALFRTDLLDCCWLVGHTGDTSHRALIYIVVSDYCVLCFRPPVLISFWQAAHINGFLAASGKQKPEAVGMNITAHE